MVLFFVFDFKIVKNRTFPFIYKKISKKEGLFVFLSYIIYYKNKDNYIYYM